jgi:hypothetical protein
VIRLTSLAEIERPNERRYRRKGYWVLFVNMLIGSESKNSVVGQFEIR